MYYRKTLTKVRWFFYEYERIFLNLFEGFIFLPRNILAVADSVVNDIY